MSDPEVGRTEQLTHTRGPWQLHEDGLAVFGAGPDRDQVIDASVSSPRLTEAEQTANARLIAAAPELLAVAVEAENWFDNHGSDDDEGAQMLLAMFRAAIAKAGGRA